MSRAIFENSRMIAAASFAAAEFSCVYIFVVLDAIIVASIFVALVLITSSVYHPPKDSFSRFASA